MEGNSVKWVRLGDYIEQCDERNTAGSNYPVIGINRDKTFMPTVANLDGVDIAKYKIVSKGMFVFSGMQTGRDICIRIGLYDKAQPALISPAYTTFFINKENDVLPEYFFMYFNREESDRYGWFISDSSVRANLDWPRFLDIEIPLPSVAEQQKVVNAWRAFREIKEQNEAKAAPLMQLCQSYIQELKHKYPMQEIGPYIQECDERNTDLNIKLSQGIANTKVFQSPKQVALNSKSDKIVRTGQFGYNRATTRNGEKISIAYRLGADCTVSSAYCVFKITHEEILDPYFLWMWVARPEFDRYARYMSKGSAHEFFEFEEMCRVKIPLPPIEVQQAIVNIYKCANEAKRIAEEADRLSREVCPALLQHVINS
ncbi:MAG: restriction endonuclease subunit S [Marinifilaceae bacterium]|nr:restriction endonuclease subunit S [Marinifilaceae bacterium]